MIKTYQQQLQELANAAGITVKDAFERAGIPGSTYYRSMTGPRAMTYETADRVARAIRQIADAA